MTAYMVQRLLPPGSINERLWLDSSGSVARGSVDTVFATLSEARAAAEAYAEGFDSYEWAGPYHLRVILRSRYFGLLGGHHEEIFIIDTAEPGPLAGFED